MQALSRMRAARSEWKAQRRAVFAIAIRLRVLLARARLRLKKREQDLLFQLAIIRGLQVTRVGLEEDQSPREQPPRQQKLWADPALKTLRISWLPNGGKRPDENPIRVEQLTAVSRVASEGGDQDDVLEVAAEDGRTWKLKLVAEEGGEETCALLVAGLSALIQEIGKKKKEEEEEDGGRGVGGV